MLIVLEKGLEPLNLAVLVPKTSAYTNSATPAIVYIKYLCTLCAHQGSNLGHSP